MGYCKTNHSGPLCTKCLPAYHFDAATVSCEACPEFTGYAFASLAFCVSAVVVLLVVYTFIMRTAVTRQLWTRSVQFMRRLGLVPKLKIAFAFGQIFLGIPLNYGVRVPDDYDDWVRWLRWMQFSILDLYPDTCLGTYVRRLNLVVWVWIVLAASAWALPAVVLMAVRRQTSSTGEQERGGSAVHVGIPASLMVLFIATPTVSRDRKSVV